MSGELPELPDIGADVRAPMFVLVECRTCAERSPWYHDDGTRRDHYEWQDLHVLARGVEHATFYMWRITRASSTVSVRRRRPRH
jgi:hypothetical protein